MKKFEYKIASFKFLNPTTTVIEINKLGSEGWELIYGENDSFGRRLIFKRAIEEESIITG